jgi:hypothetical protein
LAIIRASPEQINSWQKFANPKTPKGSLFVQIPKGLLLMD